MVGIQSHILATVSSTAKRKICLQGQKAPPHQRKVWRSEWFVKELILVCENTDEWTLYCAYLFFWKHFTTWVNKYPFTHTHTHTQSHTLTEKYSGALWGSVSCPKTLQHHLCSYWAKTVGGLNLIFAVKHGAESKVCFSVCWVCTDHRKLFVLSHADRENILLEWTDKLPSIIVGWQETVIWHNTNGDLNVIFFFINYFG